MPVWWTLDQALIWVATRDESLVADADPLHDDGTPERRLSWLHLCLNYFPDDEDIPEVFKILPIDTARMLLSAISEERIKAKFEVGAKEQAEPTWFLRARIVTDAPGKIAQARVNWHHNKPPPEGTPNECFPIISAEDLKREFPLPSEDSVPVVEEKEVVPSALAPREPTPETREQAADSPKEGSLVAQALEILRLLYPAGVPRAMREMHIVREVNNHRDPKERALNRYAVRRALTHHFRD